MISALERERIARQLNLPGFGFAQQEMLAGPRVLIVGAGGLGCPIIQQLAAVGVGAMNIWDNDSVDISNIHRQILFGTADAGKPKATLAAARARDLQPDCQAQGIVSRLVPDNIISAVNGCDLVIDGSDNFATKFLVADACEITGTPLVWGTVLRFHGDVALWHSGTNQRGVGLRDLFPEQLPAHAVPDCATAGVLGATTSVVGGLMATAAIGWLTDLDTSVGRVTSYDAFPPMMRSIQVHADPARDVVTSLGDYGQGDSETVKSAIARGAAVIDIRESEEGPSPRGAVRLPLSSISSFADIQNAAEGNDTIVLLCAGGVRSARVLENNTDTALAAGVTLLSYPGGMKAWEEI